MRKNDENMWQQNAKKHGKTRPKNRMEKKEGENVHFQIEFILYSRKYRVGIGFGIFCNKFGLKNGDSVQITQVLKPEKTKLRVV